MKYVQITDVSRVPELYTEIVPGTSTLSVYVAPKSEYATPYGTVSTEGPTSVTTGGVRSGVLTLTVRVTMLPRFPATST